MPGLKVSSFSSVHSTHNYGSTLSFSQLGLQLPPMTFFTSPESPGSCWASALSPPHCKSSSSSQIYWRKHKFDHACNSQVCFSASHLSPSVQTKGFGIDYWFPSCVTCTSNSINWNRNLLVPPANLNHHLHLSCRSGPMTTVLHWTHTYLDLHLKMLYEPQKLILQIKKKKTTTTPKFS